MKSKTELLDRYGKNSEERILLSRALDKLSLAQNHNIPASTSFLSPSEQAAIADILPHCGHPRHIFWGGHGQAERKVCFFLPDWQDEDGILDGSDDTLAAIEATFPTDATLSHRDMLGSLMGLGLTREKLGDLFLDAGTCQLILLRETLPIVLSQWTSAGRWTLHLQEIPLSLLHPKPPQVKIIRDTVATLRLDSVLACGFSTSRAKASDLISAGSVSVNHRECIKSDRLVTQGDVLSCRALGKCVVKEVLGQSKKGRMMLLLERYI